MTLRRMVAVAVAAFAFDELVFPGAARTIKRGDPGTKGEHELGDTLDDPVDSSGSLVGAKKVPTTCECRKCGLNGALVSPFKHGHCAAAASDLGKTCLGDSDHSGCVSSLDDYPCHCPNTVDPKDCTKAWICSWPGAEANCCKQDWTCSEEDGGPCLAEAFAVSCDQKKTVVSKTNCEAVGGLLIKMLINTTGSGVVRRNQENVIVDYNNPGRPFGCYVNHAGNFAELYYNHAQDKNTGSPHARLVCQGPSATKA